MEQIMQVWMADKIAEGAGWQGLPDDARVWLYCANRVLSEDEAGHLGRVLDAFLAQWSAHGQALDASWRLEGRRALVIGLNERSAGATGCSIDKLVHALESFTGSNSARPLNWFLRDTVIHYYMSAEVPSKANWVEDGLAAFWAKRKAEHVGPATPVVDGVVSSKADCMPTLVKRFDATWHAEMWR